MHGVVRNGAMKWPTLTMSLEKMNVSVFVVVSSVECPGMLALSWVRVC